MLFHMKSGPAYSEYARKFMDRPSVGEGNVLYIPTRCVLANKVTAFISCILGLSALLCGLLAFSLCQTLMPSIGLVFLGFVLFIFAYQKYRSAWTKLSLPHQPHPVKAITEAEYRSLLRTWRCVHLGSYVHRVYPRVRICEGNLEEMKQYVASPRNNRVLFIQELDFDALRKNRPPEARYLSVLNVLHHQERIRQILHTDSACIQAIALPWEQSLKGPEGVIYTATPIGEEEGMAALARYTESYLRAFLAGIEQAVPSSLARKRDLFLVVPPLGVMGNQADLKILSKIAFLQAAETLAKTAHSTRQMAHLSITLIFIDPDTPTPLRSVM